ncbi:MAG: FtsX-like permease family protein [Paracoccaceae bacterium]|jgi:cell division transport system permease protein
MSMNAPSDFGIAPKQMTADRIVPPSGFSARLTVWTAAAMAFLAVFALALSLAADRLATRWSADLAHSSTLRISAPTDQMDAQISAAQRVLETTTGVESFRILTKEEQAELLAPWFGAEMPIEQLPLPQLIEIKENEVGFDPQGLRLRLSAEVPGAVLDDHMRWRQPVVTAARGLNALGLVIMAVIIGTTGTMITLAASAALAANAQVIQVLRLVGATDGYIAGAFVRRFTMRVLSGAAVGTIVGLGVMMLMPTAAFDEEQILTRLSFEGSEWVYAVLITPAAALVAFFSTRRAALSTLKDLR